MNLIKLEAMRDSVWKAQKIMYETHSCIIIGCDNCECAYICELTNCLIKFIQHEINRYDAKGELKDDNN